MKYLKYFESWSRIIAIDKERKFGKFYWAIDNEPRRFRKQLEKACSGSYTEEKIEKFNI